MRLGAALLVGLLGVPRATAQNVLLVVADDLGVDAVAAYGEHPDPPPTPNLDALARAGVLFRRAYADPVCSPTRTTLLTGHYGVHSGVGTSIPANVAAQGGPFVPTLTYLPALLPEHRSAVLGKWHLTTGEQFLESHKDPVQRGFEFHRGSLYNLVGDYFSWQKSEADGSGVVLTTCRTYATSENVDDALDAIEAFGADPWFVVLAPHSPHHPFHVPPAHLHSQAVDGSSPEPLLHRAMVEALDSELGRLLSGIRPAVWARTTLLFVGDNGTAPAATTAPFDPEHAKGEVYEGGIRVPLLIAGRGVAAPGREVDALVNTVDLFPTVLELLGRDPPPSDGISLLPYLRDPGARPRRAWVHSARFWPNGFGPYEVLRRSARDERWKLILREGSAEGSAPAVEFYDLLADPLELHDLWPTLTPPQHRAYEDLAAVLADLTPAPPAGGEPDPAREPPPIRAAR